MNGFQYRTAGRGRKVFIIICLTVMIGYVLLILYPLFNMFVSSFRTTRDIFRAPFALPKQWDFSNYHKVLIEKGFIRYFFNSLLVTGVSMVFVVLFGSMAAYGLSRYKFKGNTLLYMLFLSGIMLPLKAAIISLYQIIRSLGLVNNFLSVILIFIAMGLPSTVFVLAGFMRSIHVDLENAARIDGCNDVRIYWQIVMPITMPAVALATIYNAVPIWNDFFFPLVFLNMDKLKTLPIGLSSFMGQYSTDWSLLFTGLSVAIFPILILYLFMSNYFIKGMTAGAVK